MPSPARQPGLSHDQVVDVALEIVDAEGLDGLTMRRLAGKLGVAATAIYWHVGDKETLLDALAERIAARVSDIPVAGDDPVERLVSIGVGLRRNLLEQPSLVGLVHQQGHTALLFQPVRRALVRELSAAGLRGTSTARALQVILNHISGSVLNDVQIARSPAQHETPEELWAADDAPDDPELRSALARPLDPGELFGYSLTVLAHALIERSGDHG